jgi:hypothetical protein
MQANRCASSASDAHGAFLESAPVPDCVKSQLLKSFSNVKNWEVVSTLLLGEDGTFIRAVISLVESPPILRH